jgi:4-hydroxybenzoate polyprenyltransferase
MIATTRRLRLIVVLARPAVVVLVGMFAAIGLAQSGHANDAALLGKTLIAVIASLLFAVAVNDIADERIDRVNLPADPHRPLVAGTGTRAEMTIVALASAALALGSSLLLHWPAPLIVGGGLAFTAGYSLRPVRIADRGVIAPMLLPAAYVAVPYLLGILAGRGSVTRTDLLLLAGLYSGFIGRIVLKDFRDVRGDALFGKRTFLVRHGRRATCWLSATFLVLGVSVLPFVRRASIALVAAYALYLAFTLVLLWKLARSTSARRDSALIAAIAILGRGMLATLYAHFALLAAHWSLVGSSAFVAALAVIITGSALDVVRTGPITDMFIPAAFTADEPRPTDAPATLRDPALRGR